MNRLCTAALASVAWWWFACSGVARAITAEEPPPLTSETPEVVTSEAEAGGTHLRISTPTGPVHVFRPAGYDRRTAGIIVYVHGYYVGVDTLVINYRNQKGGLVAEVLTFVDGLVRTGHGTYLSGAENPAGVRG